MTAQVAIEITQLGPDETAQLHDLLALFGDAFEEPETYNDKRPDDTYIEKLLTGNTCIVLTARLDGAVLGGLIAYELPKFEQKRSEIYIYDLAVAQSSRRRGVATALIERLQRIAAERGAWVVFVQADHGDDPAIALYTKLGVREDVLHFDIDVPRGG